MKLKIAIAAIVVILIAFSSLLFVFKKQIFSILEMKNTTVNMVEKKNKENIIEENELIKKYNLDIKGDFESENINENEELIYNSETIFNKEVAHENVKEELEKYFFKDKNYVYNSEHECYIEEESYSIRSTVNEYIKFSSCFWISHTDKYIEKNNVKYYVVISGKLLDIDNENQNPFNYNVQGYFRFVALNSRNNKFSIFADSDYQEGGGYGNPPIFFKTVGIGQNNRIGWMVIDSYSHFGEEIDILNIYTPINKNIISIFNSYVRENNSSKCEIDLCEVYQNNTKIKTIKSNKEYYNLKLEESQITMGKALVGKKLTRGYPRSS